MLLLNYITIPLKQSLRIKIAFFFTLLFPVTLYLLHGQNDQAMYLITFLNFAMQCAMLQAVGIFTSAHKSLAWDNYVATLPAPAYYPLIGIMISMFIIGMAGFVLIGTIDLVFFHALGHKRYLLAILSATVGAIPMGALGYYIGAKLDQKVARNTLTFTNLIFLFFTLVPQDLQKTLGYFSLPNAWFEFSWKLVLFKKFSFYNFSILSLYFIIFLFLIPKLIFPRNNNLGI